MKIAIVTNKIHSTGGVQIFTRDISNILEERGHEVIVIGEESLPVKPERDLEEKVGEHFNWLNKEERCDVVLCNGEFGYAVQHPRAINVFHGNYYGYALSLKDFVPEEITKKRLEKAEMQKESAKGKYIVTISKFSKKWLEEGGIKVDKVIHNSADTSIFYPRKAKISDFSIALGRDMYFEKGFDILEKLAEAGIKIKLFSKGKIESSNVMSVGFINNGKLSEEYNKAQLLLHPSRFEGGSLVMLEAMACGCPILTTPMGYGYDIKRIIPNFVADPNDIKEFLAKYILLTNEREKYSQEALNYFKEFHNPKTFKSRWISLVENL